MTNQTFDLVQEDKDTSKQSINKEFDLIQDGYVDSELNTQNYSDDAWVSVADSPELKEETTAYIPEYARDKNQVELEQFNVTGYTARDLLPEEEFRTTDYGVDDAIAAHFRQNNAILGLVRHVDMQFSTENNNIDANFNAVDEANKWLSVFNSAEQQEYLFEANNKANFDARIERLQKDQKDFEIMSHYGDYSNLMLGFLSAAVDVDILIPGMQTYKMAKTSSKTANLLRRLQNAGKGASTGIAANAATGSLLLQTNPSYTKGDMIADLMLGGALGGVIGGLQSGTLTHMDIKRHQDGSIEIPGLDKYHDEVKQYVDRMDGQEVHSKVDGAPITPEDGVLRSLRNPVLYSGLDPKQITLLTDLGAEGVKKLSRTARTRLGKMTEEAQNFLVPKKTETKLDEAVDSLKVKASRAAESGKAEELAPERPKQETETVSDGETIDTTTETPKEPVGLSNETIKNINDTLVAVHGKDIPQLDNALYRGDELEEISIKYNDGRTQTYKNSESSKDADYMASVIRTNTLVDTSAGLNKMETRLAQESQKRFENELKDIREVGTDFAKAMKQSDSLVLKDFMLKVATSATGNNTLTGLNAATLKNGNRNFLQQHFAIHQSSIRARAEEIMSAQDTKNILRHNRFFTTDKRPFNQASREVAELVSDLNLLKSEQHVRLANELNTFMEANVNRSSLWNNKQFDSEVGAIAAKYNINGKPLNKHTLKAAIGQTMTSWRSVDLMKGVPVEDVNAGPVRGSETLERSFYQPQKASGDIIQDYKSEGYSRDSITAAFEEGYRNGLQLKNPKMSVEDIDNIAGLHARSIVGRYWEVGSTKAGDAKDFTKFTEEIDQYIQTNTKLDEVVKEDLLQLKISLEADAATPSFLKSVTPFDRTASVDIVNEVTGQTKKINAGQFMQPVDADSWAMYINRVSGEASLASKGIKGREELSSIRRLIKKEFNASGKYSKEQVDDFLHMYDAIKAQLLSEPNPNIDNSSSSVFWFRAMKRALNLAVLNKLFIPQLAETAVVLSGLPIKRQLDYLGFAAMKNDSKKVLRNNFRTLEELSVNFDVLELFNSPQMNYVEEFGHATTRQKVMQVLDVGEQAQRRMFFMNNVMNWQRKIAWLGTMETVMKSAQKNGWKVTKRMANQGITQDVLNIIKRESDNGRIILDKDGIVLDYDGVNITEALGRDNMIKLSGVLQTVQDSEKILRPPVGQSNHILQQPFISALTTLKSYPLHSFNSLGLRHWEYKDKSTLGLVASTAMFSYAAAYLKMIIEGKDTDELKMAEGMLKYNSLSGTFGSLVDVAGKTMDIDALKMSPDYGRNNTFNLPVVQYMNNLSQVPRVMMHAAGNNLTSADMNVINGVGGFITQNPFTAALSNEYKDFLKERTRQERLEERRVQRQQERIRKQQEQRVIEEEPEEVTKEAEAVDVLSQI